MLRHSVEHPADDLRAAAHDRAAQRTAHAGLVDLQSKVLPRPARRLGLAQALIDIGLPRLTECGHIHVVQRVRRPFGQIVADLAAGLLCVFARHVGKHGADAASAAVRNHVGQAVKAHLLRRVFQESGHCAQCQRALVAAALHLHVARRVHQRAAAHQRRAYSRRAKRAADHAGECRVHNAAHDRVVYKFGRVAAAQLLYAQVAPDVAQIILYGLVARKVLVQPLADVFADCIARRAAGIAQVVGIHLIAVNAGQLRRRAPERIRAAADRIVNVGQRADRRHSDRMLFCQLGHTLGHRVMRALLQIGLEHGDIVLRRILALCVAQIGQDPAFSARHVVDELRLVRLKACAVGRLEHLILLRITVLQIPFEVRPVGQPLILLCQLLPLLVLRRVHVGLECGLLRPYVVCRDKAAVLIEERALHAVVFGHIVVICLFGIQVFGAVNARYGAAHIFRCTLRALRCAGQPLVRFLLQSVPVGLCAARQQIIEIHRARALQCRAARRLGRCRSALRIVRRHCNRLDRAVCGLPLVFRHTLCVLRRAPLRVQFARKRFSRARNCRNTFRNASSVLDAVFDKLLLSLLFLLSRFGCFKCSVFLLAPAFVSVDKAVQRIADLFLLLLLARISVAALGAVFALRIARKALFVRVLPAVLLLGVICKGHFYHLSLLYLVLAVSFFFVLVVLLAVIFVLLAVGVFCVVLFLPLSRPASDASTPLPTVPLFALVLPLVTYLDTSTPRFILSILSASSLVRYP